MRFIVVAQLPKSLSIWLNEQGHDAIHTLDLPRKNSTSDMMIIRIARDEKRTVITKDTDFVNYRILKGQPENILLLTTGNIKNSKLRALFEANIQNLIELFEGGKAVIEMDASNIAVLI